MGGLKASGAELCHATYLCRGLEACREPRKPGRIPQGTGHAAPHAMLHRRHQHPSCELISPYGITSQCGLVYTVRVRVYVVVVLDSNSLLGLVSWPAVPFHTSWDDKLAHASHAARCTPAHSVQREAKCCSRCVRRAVLACALCEPLYCV